MTGARSDAEKSDAYGAYFLGLLRRDVQAKRDMLACAEAKLAIGEAEYAEGKIVTGDPDGFPGISRKLFRLFITPKRPV